MFLFFKHFKTIAESGLVFSLIAQLLFNFTNNQKGETAAFFLILLFAFLLVLAVTYVSSRIMPLKLISISVDAPIDFIENDPTSRQVVWKFENETFSAPRQDCFFITVSEDSTNNLEDYPTLPYCTEYCTEEQQTILAFGKLYSGEKSIRRSYYFYVSDKTT